MNRAILTAAEMRAAEAHEISAGTSVEILMERAGAAVTEAVWRVAGSQPTLVLCGPGNNGGDGYVVARLLAERGVDVRVAASGPAGSGAAASARARWSGAVVGLDAADPSTVVVDALFGTGLTRRLEPGAEAALHRLCAAARISVAVDLPSGVATDDGTALGRVPRFDLTVALGAWKPAHVLQPSAALCGRLVMADIGVAGTSSASVITRPSLAQPTAADHKYSRGMVAIVGGVMSGAARLAAEAAARSGAGYVLLIEAESTGMPPHAIVRRAAGSVEAVEAAIADPRIGALVIGPGLGRDPRAKAMLDAALASDHPLVLDGDALHLLAGVRLKRLGSRPHPTILTPHDGEFEALFGEPEGSKIDRARHAAGAAGAILVAKGADTVIADPAGRIGVAGKATPWLSTAGTGDVLAGVIAAMLARGLAPFEAASAGVWLHGEAARRAGRGFIADDLASHLSDLL